MNPNLYLIQSRTTGEAAVELATKKRALLLAYGRAVHEALERANANRNDWGIWFDTETREFHAAPTVNLTLNASPDGLEITERVDADCYGDTAPEDYETEEFASMVADCFGEELIRDWRKRGLDIV